MQFVSWNVNGIRAALNKGLMEFITEVAPDVLCLQEVRALPEQVDFAPEGYRVTWNPAEKKGYSGTLTLTRTDTCPEPRSVRLGLDLPEHDAEGRVVTTELEDAFLVNVYTPNSQRGLTRLDYRTRAWDTAFLAYMKALEGDKPVIFCGDLNVAHKEIDLANPKTNTKNAGFTPQERASFDNLIHAGFIDTFREFTSEGGHYTWWSHRSQARERNIGWRLDYFGISAALRPRLISSTILPHVMGSDHCPIAMVLE